jgi:hypothetical protein
MRRSLTYISTCLLTLFVTTNIANAMPLCPSTTLEPTLKYGRAFGSAEAATISASLHPTEDEELVFQYFEYQTNDPGYAPVYGVHLLYDEKKSEGRLFLTRIKDKEAIQDDTGLDGKTVDALIAYASPIVQRTHYPPGCSNALKKGTAIVYTDGFVIQVASGSTLMPNALQGGEAYSPIKGSDADRMVKVGRMLRQICLKRTSTEALAKLLADGLNTP